MKKFLLTLVLLVGMFFGLFAQKLTYQAVVRDNNQQLVTNTAVKATVTIDFTGDQADYDTTITDVSTNIHGLLSIEFGGKTLNGRDWTGATIAVKVVNKNDESIVYVNGDARPVSAVPYALSVNGQSIQNYLTEHHYVDLDKLEDTLGAYSTTAAMDGRHYLTSDSAVIKTMQGNISKNADGIDNLILHTAKAAIRDSVAGQIHDSISNIAAKAHTHDNMAILNATEAPYTDADSAKLHDIADGAQKNVQSDWKQGTTTADDYIKNKPSITDTVNNILTTDGYVTASALDNRHYLTSDSAVIKTMQGNISTNANSIANLTLHTAKAAIRDSVASQIHDSIAPVAAKAHTHDNMAILNATQAPYTDADSAKLHDIAEGAEVNVQSDWKQAASDADDFIKNKPSITDTVNNILTTGKYVTETTLDARHYLRSDSTVITTMQGNITTNANSIATNTADIAALAGRMNTFNTNVCDSVKNCDFSGNTSIQNMLQQLEERLSGKIDSLAHLVDSLSKRTPGGGETAIVDTVVCYPNLGSNDSVKKTVTRGQDLDLSTTFTHPVEANWEIAGWNTKADGTGTSYTNTLTTSDNLTLYAQWRTFCTGTPSSANEVGGTDNRIDSLKDVENNKYAVVQIGNQCWMKENLRTDVDGSVYPKKNDGQDDLTPDEQVIYGRLYTWTAMMNGKTSSDTVPSGVQGICPTGWHVPSDTEWTQLTAYVKSQHEYVCEGCSGTDNESYTYCIAKALSQPTGWSNTSEGCNAGDTGDKANLTGFSAVPASLCFSGIFIGFGFNAYFWSATQDGDDLAWYRHLGSDDSSVYGSSDNKGLGFSVRCLRDAGVGGGTTPVPVEVSCEQVMECMGDTLGKLNTKIEAQGAEIETLNGTVTTQGNTIDSLAHLVDSLSKLPHGGDEPTTTLGISSNPSSDTVKLCGQSSVTVTYTATVENGTADSYSWSTSGGSATESTSNTYTVSYTTAGTYTVTCTAAGLSATKQVTIASSGTAPALGLCEDCNAGSITVKTKTNVASIVWLNASNDSVSNSTTSLTQSAAVPAGIYTATAKSSDGCTVTRTAVLGNYVAHPCMVASLRAGTPLDGGKYANKEYGTGTQLDSVSDHEGNVYRVVQIGEGDNAQCWLAENMRATTSPSTGSTIVMNPMVKSYSSKSAGYYSNNESQYGKNGVLYNWCAAVDTFYNDGSDKHHELANAEGDSSITWTVTFSGSRRGICPEGWHVPTDAEWNAMEKAVAPEATDINTTTTGYQGSSTDLAAMLSGGCNWLGNSESDKTPGSYSNPNRNSTGFSALPAGYYDGGSFQNPTSFAYFWSATPSSKDRACNRFLGHKNTGVKRDTYNRYYGISVRCLRD